MLIQRRGRDPVEGAARQLEVERGSLLPALEAFQDVEAYWKLLLNGFLFTRVGPK
jgi:hypothetical protein